MRETLSTLKPYMWRYRRGILLGMGALVIKDLAAALQPLVIRRIVDGMTAGAGLSFALRLVSLLITLAIFKGFFQYWMRVILIGMSRDVEYDLRNDFFAHLVRLAPDFYGKNRTGDIMARSTNDLNAVRMMLGPGIMYWTETSLTFVFAVAVMLTMDWRLTLLALLPAPAGQSRRDSVRAPHP